MRDNPSEKEASPETGDSMTDVRFATIGTSAITERFVAALAEVPGTRYVAAYSRDLSRAKEFGESRGATLAFDDLNALAASDQVDAVYVASPNGAHARQASLLAQGGKHVLVEKAFASNEREATEAFARAHESGVVCMEAMRNLHTPGFHNVAANLARVGRVSQATFRYGKVTSRIAKLRAGEHVNQFDPALSEGGLMDIGVYAVEPAIALFGRPERVSASLLTIPLPWEPEPSGAKIDLAGSVVLSYPRAIVDLNYSKVANDFYGAQVAGDAGTLMWEQTNCPADLRFVPYEDKGMVYSAAGGKAEVIPANMPDNDMTCEVATFVDAINGDADALGRVAFCERVTVGSLAVMDEARRQAGIRFPADDAR
jgi:predicted dehydrogenase